VAGKPDISTKPATPDISTQQAKPVVAYILAASHSGSTLLAMLLASHPEVCTTGELKAQSLGDPERYRCSCGAPIRRCEFWNDIAARMAARGHVFDITRADTHLSADASPYEEKLLEPLVRGASLEALRSAGLGLSPSWRKRLARFHAVNESLVRSLCDRTGTRVVVDSSKVGIRLKYLLRNPGIDVRVVRLIRDGRAVALTYTDPANYADASAPNLRGGGDGTSRDRERLTPWDAAHEWRRSNEEADALLARLDPTRQITVRYEELCTNTAAVLSKLWAFVGVSPFQFAEGWRARNHHVIGNGMRFDSSEEVRLDERWKTALPPAALAVFEAEAGALNRRLGYTR
jgi:hypothetical protein